MRARARAEPSSRVGKEKISVTVDRDLWKQARALPWATSGSAVVNEALRRLVASELLGMMLDRLTAEFGPVDEELVVEAEARWFGG